jgi:hypothetical protein
MGDLSDIVRLLNKFSRFIKQTFHLLPTTLVPEVSTADVFIQ